MSDLNWWTIISLHWGKLLGALLGLIFAILSITISIWWAFFIYLSVSAGLFIGWRLELSGGLRNLLERLFSSKKDL